MPSHGSKVNVSIKLSGKQTDIMNMEKGLRLL